jgi:hypothetical protein
MINSDFKSCDDSEFASLDAARRASIATAAKVASESVAAGEMSAAVEVQIFESGQMVVRQVVTLSVAELTTA